MIYDWPRLLATYNISYDAETAIARQRIVIPCPYCRDEPSKMKGSIQVETTTFSCFKCGFHPIADTIKLLTGENWNDIRMDYKLKLDLRDLYLRQNKVDKPKKEVLQLPPFTGPLNSSAKNYLRSRNFDPDYLEKRYKLQATGHLSDYKFRIIIPIYYNKQLISYQGRDYTGEASLRYMSCLPQNEVIHYKDICYGIDDVQGDHVIVCEGITDKWVIGDSAVATYGLGYTDKQLLMLSSFARATVLFDSEPQAKARAEKLGGELSGLGVEVDIILLKEGDPGSMDQKDADELVKNILRKK
jgi:hypothetical protein